MRVIIAGSREGATLADVNTAMVECGWQPTTVLSGAARGVDHLGELWAMQHGVDIKRYTADWNRHGKGAGHRRNAVMAANAEALVAVWDGKSRGTKGMIEVAKKRGLKVHVYLLEQRQRPFPTLTTGDAE